MENSLYRAQLPYFTTPQLLSMYADYGYPRDKIKSLVKKGDLITVKQGLYVLGAEYERPYSLEVLSSMIYGPSAVSLDYALSYHGLIPERVEEVSSICFKRDKQFHTSVGRFSYKYLSLSRYTCGITYQQTDLGNFFMASPEKALCDKVYFSSVSHKKEMADYLMDELRIEESALSMLDLSSLSVIVQRYKRQNCQYLLQTISEIQR